MYAYAVDLTEVISTLVKDSWIILPVLLPWVVISIAARRFEKRRKDQGAWNESGPIDPTYAPANPTLRAVGMRGPTIESVGVDGAWEVSLATSRPTTSTVAAAAPPAPRRDELALSAKTGPTPSSRIEPPSYRPLDPSGHFVAFVHDNMQHISTRDAYDHWFGLATGEQPRQAHLDELFAVANRVVVKATGQSRGRAIGPEVVVDTREQRSLTDLATALRIQEIPEDDRHCACLGGPVLELFADDRELASIACQHGRAIRWQRWLPDAPMVDETLLDAWLRGEGIHPDLLDRLYHNRYDQNWVINVGYQRPGARPLTQAEQRVRVLELQRNDGFDALELLGKLNGELAADPSLALAYVIRGKLHHQLGRFDECVEDLDSARRYGIEDAMVLCERAVALHHLGRIEEAIVDCSAAIELTPALARAWNSRGLLLLVRGRVTDAIRDLDRAVALAPKWILPVLNRALAYDARGDRRRARKEAGRASTLLPREVHPDDAEDTAARRIIERLLAETR